MQCVWGGACCCTAIVVLLQRSFAVSALCGIVAGLLVRGLLCLLAVK